VPEAGAEPRGVGLGGADGARGQDSVEGAPNGAGWRQREHGIGADRKIAPKLPWGSRNVPLSRLLGSHPASYYSDAPR
jgi:hypothetical protein